MSHQLTILSHAHRDFTVVEQEVRVLRLRGPGQELLSPSEITT